MDGLSQSAKPKIEEKECEIEALTDATNMKIVTETNVKKATEGKSLSVLSLGGKNATITERNFNELNFSGLFPKRKHDQDGDDLTSRQPVFFPKQKFYPSFICTLTPSPT